MAYWTNEDVETMAQETVAMFSRDGTWTDLWYVIDDTDLTNEWLDWAIENQVMLRDLPVCEAVRETMQHWHKR